jgi:hypothetical protein
MIIPFDRVFNASKARVLNMGRIWGHLPGGFPPLAGLAPSRQARRRKLSEVVQAREARAFSNRASACLSEIDAARIDKQLAVSQAARRPAGTETESRTSTDKFEPQCYPQRCSEVVPEKLKSATFNAKAVTDSK